MNGEAFHLLLKKYTAGTCSKHERELVEKWFAALDDESFLYNPQAITPEVESRIWQRIQNEIQAKRK